MKNEELVFLVLFCCVSDPICARRESEINTMFTGVFGESKILENDDGLGATEGTEGIHRREDLTIGKTLNPDRKQGALTFVCSFELCDPIDSDSSYEKEEKKITALDAVFVTVLFRRI
mmetsp:Transcript_9048/g.18797  ORF Transcript_9048/g.18797 Transcript_9048/m.18797 type:complete len:118 (-) Transcript_9048:778-1131(-)